MWAAKTLTVILECLGLQAKPNFRHPQVHICIGTSSSSTVLTTCVLLTRPCRGGPTTCHLCQAGTRFQCVEDGACELPFEVAECFAATLSFGLFAFEVGAARRVDACLRDRDPMQGAGELAVAAAVEQVTANAARACFQGREPLWRASCASVWKRSIGPISASSFAAVIAPQPGSSSSAGAVCSIRCSS
jgi:hypothetical protein